MGVNVTRVVKFIRKGDKGSDAVRYWLIPSVSSVSMADVENGDGKPTPSSVSCRLVKQVGDDTPTTITDVSAAGLTMYYTLVRNDDVATQILEYSGGRVAVPTNTVYRAIEFYLYRGSQLIDTVTIAIVCDGQPGEPGAPGQDGEDAISIKVSPQTLVLKRNGKAQRLKVYVDLFKGAAQIPYGDASQGEMLCSTLTSSDRVITDGLTWNFGTENTRFYYSFIYSGATDINLEIPFTVTYNGKEYPEKIIVQTIADGDRGPVLRGPQMWSDCATGYNFQCGAEGEEWKDLVLYDTHYYSCVKSHTKTASNYPGSASDQANGYWRLGQQGIELVATKILLASYALVKNLGVECIDMKDAAGNILFQAKDGDVICKTGTFENVVFSGLMKKKRTIVTAANFSSIFERIEAEVYDINFDKCGTWLDIQYLPADIIIYPRSMRALCGNTILLYNNTSNTISISALVTFSFNSSSGGFVSFNISPNEFAALECKVGAVNGKETAYFLAQRGNINTNLDN